MGPQMRKTHCNYTLRRGDRVASSATKEFPNSVAANLPLNLRSVIAVFPRSNVNRRPCVLLMHLKSSLGFCDVLTIRDAYKRRV